jgi:hypothetical protein
VAPAIGASSRRMAPRDGEEVLPALGPFMAPV